MILQQDDVLRLLKKIPDPEIPVVDIVELGIVRGVECQNDAATVRITPTYSGCPAMHMIESDIRESLLRAGFRSVNIETVHTPPWTTDWLSDETKEKLRAYGIAPPGRTIRETLIGMPRRERKLPCPFCGSTDTVLKSEFGATACKSMYFCNGCSQPFEHFKAF